MQKIQHTAFVNLNRYAAASEPDITAVPCGCEIGANHRID